MSNGNRDDLFLELLRNLQSEHSEMRKELQAIRAGVIRVAELSSELSTVKDRMHSLEREVGIVKHSLMENTQKLIIPSFLGEGVKFSLAVALTALIGLWVSKIYDDTVNPPPPPPHKVEKGEGFRPFSLEGG